MDAQQSDFELESAMSQLAVGLRGRGNQFNRRAKLSITGPTVATLQLKTVPPAPVHVIVRQLPASP